MQNKTPINRTAHPNETTSEQNMRTQPILVGPSELHKTQIQSRSEQSMWWKCVFPHKLPEHIKTLRRVERPNSPNRPNARTAFANGRTAFGANPVLNIKLPIISILQPTIQTNRCCFGGRWSKADLNVQGVFLFPNATSKLSHCVLAIQQQDAQATTWSVERWCDPKSRCQTRHMGIYNVAMCALCFVSQQNLWDMFSLIHTKQQTDAWLNVCGPKTI